MSYAFCFKYYETYQLLETKGYDFLCCSEFYHLLRDSGYLIMGYQEKLITQLAHVYVYLDIHSCTCTVPRGLSGKDSTQEWQNQTSILGQKILKKWQPTCTLTKLQKVEPGGPQFMERELDDFTS